MGEFSREAFRVLRIPTAGPTINPHDGEEPKHVCEASSLVDVPVSSSFFNHTSHRAAVVPRV